MLCAKDPLIRWGEGTKKARAIVVLQLLLLLMGYPAGALTAERALRRTLPIGIRLMMVPDTFELRIIISNNIERELDI